jgi:hypothetical protein
MNVMAEATDERDWYTWHSDYDTPGSALARRLVAVRERIREALDAAGPRTEDLSLVRRTGLRAAMVV